MVALYKDPDGKNLFKKARRSVIGTPISGSRTRIVNINGIDFADKDTAEGV